MPRASLTITRLRVCAGQRRVWASNPRGRVNAIAVFRSADQRLPAILRFPLSWHGIPLNSHNSKQPLTDLPRSESSAILLAFRRWFKLLADWDVSRH
jgi:hypothetical protein